MTPLYREVDLKELMKGWEFAVLATTWTLGVYLYGLALGFLLWG